MRDDGEPTSHGLVDNQSPRLVAGWQDQDVGQRVVAGRLAITGAPGEDDPLISGGQPFKRLALLAVADDHHADRLVRQTLSGANQKIDAFALDQAAYV